jgi:hypothetical protein
MSGPPFALQLHRTTVWCGATGLPSLSNFYRLGVLNVGLLFHFSLFL